ncbi:MAG: hypothetical protein DRG20_05885 [Deltaproteobacteria bacterium]|nr:MAG: hypothetical protein DRG20_05885 [Deltaproteobacteria bacterium]
MIMKNNLKKETIGEFLRLARVKKGLSQYELAKKMGYKTAQSISDWEREKADVPIERIKELAEILNIDQKELFLKVLSARNPSIVRIFSPQKRADELFARYLDALKDISPALAENVKQLKFDELIMLTKKVPTLIKILEGETEKTELWDQHLKELNDFFSQHHLRKNNKTELIFTRKVPVFTAGAGPNLSFTDMGYPVGVSDRMEHVPISITDEHTFGVVIKGDSMEPTLSEGDIAIVVPSAELQNGKLCYAYFPETEETLIKRYRKIGETIFLESDNKQYDPIIITPDSPKEVKIYRVKRLIREE